MPWRYCPRIRLSQSQNCLPMIVSLSSVFLVVFDACPIDSGASQVPQWHNLPAKQEIPVQFSGRELPEEGNGNPPEYSAQETPRTEEPEGFSS